MIEVNVLEDPKYPVADDKLGSKFSPSVGRNTKEKREKEGVTT